MKIDNYIRHLELQRRGLRGKYSKLQGASDKIFFKKRLDPRFDNITETRNEIENIENKLEFLINLKKELINNEVQNQKSR